MKLLRPARWPRPTETSRAARPSPALPHLSLILALLLGAWLLAVDQAAAAVPATGPTLSGTVRSLTQNSAINLSTNGTLDWVHWGLYTETSLNRKAGVIPQISDFALLDNTNGFVFAYQYADNQNGYTWTDGDPIPAVTDTRTGVWAYGIPFIGTGFQITAPAGTNQRTLKVYCGVFGGTGRFEALLSDGSAPAYSTTFANIPGNGPSREVTLRYASATPNQTLTVRWTLAGGASSSPNVTLQAAALSAEGVNNPPVVRLTSPSPDANIAAPGNVALAATASDLDGSIAKVEFFANGTRIGQDTTAPYEATWSSPAPGRYSVTAVATDNGGETTESAPAIIVVHGSGGTLTGSGVLPATSVNLTTEGVLDWQHWGLSSSNLFNRKGGITPVLPALALIGATNLNTYQDNYTAFSWTDGTPTVSTPPIPRGVFVYGLTNGFALSIPADTTTRTLRIYAGVYGAQGHFEAWLSDFSAPAFHDHSLSNWFGSDYRVFTLQFAAASAGRTLYVRHVAEKLFDGDYGNVTLQAATLNGGGPPPPLPVTLLSPVLVDGELRFSFQSQSGRSYLGQWRADPGLGPWETFATVPGTGGLLTLTNRNLSGAPRFYRVETQ